MTSTWLFIGRAPMICAFTVARIDSIFQLLERFSSEKLSITKMTFGNIGPWSNGVGMLHCGKLAPGAVNCWRDWTAGTSLFRYVPLLCQSASRVRGVVALCPPVSPCDEK